MLVPERDLGDLTNRLTGWLRTRVPGDVAIADLAKPSTGFSNETFLFTLRHGGAEERFVVRLEPAGFHVFPRYDLPAQARTMQCLAVTDVPVPCVRWVEPDASVLGSPFYVMEAIGGEVPSEVPPYHSAGFCFEATPARRARIWWNGFETLARVHAVDWRARGLDFLGVPGGGTDPLDRQLDYWSAYLAWSEGPHPGAILAASLAWLRAHTYAPRRVGLCWGDARLPNLMYKDDAVLAVLDWEMAFLGDPEADVGWWLFMHWANGEGYDVPPLPGFPSRDETLARYAEITGAPIEHALWNEVFAAFRFGAIMARIARRMVELDIPAPVPEFETNNSCTRRLATLLGLPPPGKE